MKLAVTEEGMPSIQVDGTAYPLFMSVMGFQRWAEFRGVDFQDAISEVWSPLTLGDVGLRMLVKVSLECGEARRAMVRGGSTREIGADLVERVCALYHPLELGQVLVGAWNAGTGEDHPDPPMTETESD